MPGDLLRCVVVSQAPHFAVLIITVQVDIAQLGELVPMVDIAARDGAGLGMVMLDHWRYKWSRTAFAVWVEGMGTLHDAPAMIASAVDQLDHLPKVLTDIPNPGLASVGIEAETPWIPEAVSPNLRARALKVYEWVISRNRIGAAGVG